MNKLWCDLWEYREKDLLKLNSQQLLNTLNTTKQYANDYKKLKKNIGINGVMGLLQALDLENEERFKKLLNDTFNLV